MVRLSQWFVLLWLLIYYAGSDYPYASPDKTLGFKQALDGFPLNQDLRDMIYFGNANHLLTKPR